jgi:hypothetical protein
MLAATPRRQSAPARLRGPGDGGGGRRPRARGLGRTCSLHPRDRARPQRAQRERAEIRPRRWDRSRGAARWRAPYTDSGAASVARRSPAASSWHLYHAAMPHSAAGDAGARGAAPCAARSVAADGGGAGAAPRGQRGHAGPGRSSKPRTSRSRAGGSRPTVRAGAEACPAAAISNSPCPGRGTQAARARCHAPRAPWPIPSAASRRCRAPSSARHRDLLTWRGRERAPGRSGGNAQETPGAGIVPGMDLHDEADSTQQAGSPGLQPTPTLLRPLAGVGARRRPGSLARRAEGRGQRARALRSARSTSSSS